MAMTSIRTGRFMGVKPLYEGEDSSWQWARMAWNVDTEEGQLKRAGGFSKVFPISLYGTSRLFRLHLWPREGSNPGCIALRQDGLWRYRETEKLWRGLWAFQTLREDGNLFDFLPVKIGEQEKLLIASGQDPIYCWEEGTDDVEAFGSEEKQSQAPVNYLAMYFGRLFAAGEKEHPARLYWSQAPGDGRSIDNWGTAEEGADVSGGYMEVGTDSSPITGLKAMSNQLVILKKDRLYRLLGDRPSNFRIQPVEGPRFEPRHTACLDYGDRLFFFTEQGLFFYDGQTLRRTPHGKDLNGLLEKADLSTCQGTVHGTRLYFTMRLLGESKYNDTVAVYDVERDCFLLLRGFQVVDMESCQGKLYLLTGDGSVCAFNGSDTYDGTAIEASWSTPWSAAGSLYENKRLCELTAPGYGEGALEVEAGWESGCCYSSLPLTSWGQPSIARLQGGGRMLRLTLSNQNGEDFCLYGGMELLVDKQKHIPG